jgi:type VI secretion system Hcp family effector
MSNAIFLELDGIKGECKDSKHTDWIEVESLQWGVGRGISGPPSSTGSHTSGKASFSDMTFSKKLDASSPLLMKAVSSGQAIAKVTVHVVRSAGTGVKVPYLVFEFKDCGLTSYSNSDNGGNESVPYESFGLIYSDVKMVYEQTDTQTGDSTGQMPVFWDLRKDDV